MPRFLDLTIYDITAEGRDGCCLTFEVPPALRDTFAFDPGQYVTLRAEIAGRDVRRPYSICSVPGAPLSVGIKRVEDGLFSNHVQNLSLGDRLAVSPPEGRFHAEIGGARRYLLIAAGSGITPMLSIAGATLRSHPDASVTLVYGNRDSGAIMFLDRLSDLKDRFMGRISVLHLLSRETQDVGLMNGRIDPAKLRALTEAGLIDPATMDGVFLCGPGTMIEMAELELGTLGVPGTRIHAERFVPADGQAPRPRSEAVEAAVASGAVIETILDGRRRSFVQTRPEDAVLDAARGAGIDLPFSCAGGMCCTCRCRITQGTAEMAVNYSLEQWEIDAGFTLACQARPTSDRLVLDFDSV